MSHPPQAKSTASELEEPWRGLRRIPLYRFRSLSSVPPSPPSPISGTGETTGPWNPARSSEVHRSKQRQQRWEAKGRRWQMADGRWEMGDGGRDLTILSVKGGALKWRWNCSGHSASPTAPSDPILHSSFLLLHFLSAPRLTEGSKGSKDRKQRGKGRLGCCAHAHLTNHLGAEIADGRWGEVGQQLWKKGLRLDVASLKSRIRIWPSSGLPAPPIRGSDPPMW